MGSVAVKSENILQLQPDDIVLASDWCWWKSGDGFQAGALHSGGASRDDYRILRKLNEGGKPRKIPCEEVLVPIFTTFTNVRRSVITYTNNASLTAVVGECGGEKYIVKVISVCEDPDPKE